MAGRRLSMRRTREILRQKWAPGRGHREVALSLGASTGLARVRAAGLSWEAVEKLGELELEQRLHGSAPGGPSARRLPDWTEIHTELGKKGVTLQVLHIEDLERHPDGYAYTQFCDYHRRWRGQQKRSMRQVRRAGEKLFIYYSGKKPEIVDPQSGELREVELFVAVLGASSYTYAEATESQRSADFIVFHVRVFEYFGGVAELDARIRTLLDRLNGRPMRAYHANRRTLFLRLDQPALHPLPIEPFVCAEWKLAKAKLDYHVELDGHYDSVPHALVGEQVELRSYPTHRRRDKRSSMNRQSRSSGGCASVRWPMLDSSSRAMPSCRAGLRRAAGDAGGCRVARSPE